jgi:hypothetical protein
VEEIGVDSVQLAGGNGRQHRPATPIVEPSRPRAAIGAGDDRLRPRCEDRLDTDSRRR